MKKLITLFFFCFSAFLLQAQHTGLQTLSDLKESPAGSKIIDFINLINQGQKVTEQSINELFASGMIEKHGVKKLAGFIQDIRETDGQLTLYEADRKTMFNYLLKLKGSNHGEWLNADLKLEENPPYGITGFGLNNSGEIPQNQTPILSPGKKITFERSKKSYPSNQEIAAEADKIAKAFEDLNWFSGVVMVARDGKPVFEKAYGLADIEKGIKNTPGTKFRIGSINKSYTSVLISQMVEKGKLSYDDKLSKFDLGFPKAVADKVTIRHILTHSAGFADIFIPQYLDNIRDYKTIDDILPLLMNEPLIYEPGKNRQYSNYGYIVLGAILEKISGKPFGELLQENILDVISAKDTHYDIAENIEGEAQSYLFTMTGEKTDYTSRLEYCTPDGGMYSTTHDLLNYYQTLFYTEKLLSDKTKAMQVFQYQPGKRKWEDILPSIGTIGEAGGGPGVSALAEMNISDNIMVFVLANTDRQAAEEVGLRIMSFIEGHGYEPPQLPPALFAWKLIQKYDQSTLVKEFQNKFRENGYQEYHSGILNRLGYDLMIEEKYQEAIQVLTLNTELFPKEANPYDSLGEAYYKSGDRENARKYYQKALEIDPDLPSAREMMGKLK